MKNNYAEFEELRGQRFLFAAGRFSTFSGAERQAVYLARELIQNLNADVKFLGWGGDGPFADQIRAVGATPVVFPLNERINRWSDRLQLLKLAAFIRRDLRPDYILPYVWLHCRPLGAIWRLTNARFCWWNQRDEGRGICGTRLEKWLMQSLPAIVSNSWEGRDFLTQKFALAPDRVKVINNGVILPELGKDDQFRDQLGVPRSATLLAMVANLTRFKDHTTLLRAFAEALRLCSGTNLHLALVGSPGETTQELKSLAWDLGLHGRLHFAGTILNVERALRSVDIVAHSSQLEGCPNGALEAMALGLPVVGTDISGMRQALGIDVAAKCLSPAGDWQTLAERIAERVHNPGLCNLEGAGNRSRIQSEFSCSGMALNCLRLIAETSFQAM